MKRADYMSDDQKARWRAREEKVGSTIARTHKNCQEIFGKTVTITVEDEYGNVTKVRKFVPGPARPGKTAKDRARRAGMK